MKTKRTLLQFAILLIISVTAWAQSPEQFPGKYPVRIITDTSIFKNGVQFQIWPDTKLRLRFIIWQDTVYLLKICAELRLQKEKCDFANRSGVKELPKAVSQTGQGIIDEEWWQGKGVFTYLQKGDGLYKINFV